MNCSHLDTVGFALNQRHHSLLFTTKRLKFKIIPHGLTVSNVTGLNHRTRNSQLYMEINSDHYHKIIEVIRFVPTSCVENQVKSILCFTLCTTNKTNS